MNKRKTLGDKIHSLRLQKNYSIDDVRFLLLSYEYPVSKKTIYRWEKNEVTPDLKAITVLCDIFKITASNLLDIRYPSEREAMTKYETRFIFALRTNKTFKKILNSIIEKEENKDVKNWKEAKNVKEGI